MVITAMKMLNGSYVNLYNVAATIRDSKDMFLNKTENTPDEIWLNKFSNMIEHIAVLVENNQIIPVNLQQTALRLVYSVREKHTMSQFAAILREVGNEKL
ncbi:hypothetical protein [Salmonella phage vB_SenM-S16]|uniref:DUF7367 domain-containing protein n=1 Tax=Salmonella phage S16 TaxID=1087482 RepID=M1HNQ5_BPS16|nr:hypothetical protein I133_gp264 [Salmonella phage vB_SenM-S16]AGE48137.1 hypothetical protein [Salmonella phage vB_SenM-S16]UFK27128.1 hypothetical protein LG358_00107 [Escherichia phage UoN_LG358_1]WDR21671.1 hypothetical protein PJM34_0003 [Salmonella phage vB_SenM_UTK0003]